MPPLPKKFKPTNLSIVVVEPHPDDAFLSMGHMLETQFKEWDKTIVTVYCDRTRTREALAYATAIGAKCVTLGLEESKMLSVEEVIEPVEELKLLMMEMVAKGGNWDLLAFPLGLQHPDHKRVARTAEKDFPLALRYLDTPYQAKQKLGVELNSLINGMTVRSINYPHARKWRHVPVFKSQAKFFHFNKTVEEGRIPEILLEPYSAIRP
jgi:LmbE family N-acetylglucosaminyl deacetylase